VVTHAAERRIAQVGIGIIFAFFAVLMGLVWWLNE
jgi:hypothetical protein